MTLEEARGMEPGDRISAPNGDMGTLHHIRPADEFIPVYNYIIDWDVDCRQSAGCQEMMCEDELLQKGWNVGGNIYD